MLILQVKPVLQNFILPLATFTAEFGVRNFIFQNFAYFRNVCFLLCDRKFDWSHVRENFHPPSMHSARLPIRLEQRGKMSLTLHLNFTGISSLAITIHTSSTKQTDYLLTMLYISNIPRALRPFAVRSSQLRFPDAAWPCAVYRLRFTSWLQAPRRRCRCCF